MDTDAVYTVVMGDQTISYTDADQVPHDVAVTMGRSLGISPIAYVRLPIGESTADSVAGGDDLVIQLEPLLDAAAALGYEGVTADVLLAHLANGERSVPSTSSDEREHGRPLVHALVALLPDPMSHKAAPPETHWMIHTEFVRLDHAEPLVAAVSSHRWDERSPVSSVLLWDDPVRELASREAHDAGRDAAVLLNTHDRIAGLDVGTLVAEIEPAVLVTPPLADGAIDTAARRRMIVSGEAIERPLVFDDLDGGTSIICVYPWHDRIPVQLA